MLYTATGPVIIFIAAECYTRHDDTAHSRTQNAKLLFPRLNVVLAVAAVIAEQNDISPAVRITARVLPFARAPYTYTLNALFLSVMTWNFIVTCENAQTIL